MAESDSNKDIMKVWEKLFKKKGKDENTAEDNAEAKAAAKKAAAQRVKNLKMLSGIWKQSKITAGATKVVSNATKTILSKWKILAGLALFAMPKEFWGKLKDGVFRLWNFLKNVNWNRIINDAFGGLKVAIKTLVPVVKWIGEKIFGKKLDQKDVDGATKGFFENKEDFAKRKAQMQESASSSEDNPILYGGLFSKNKSWGDIATGIGLLAAALAPTSALMLGIGILKGGVGALSGLLKLGGAGIISGPVAAITAFIAGASASVIDGFAGADLAKEWGVDKVDGAIAGFIGGTGKGVSGAIANGFKKAGVGMGIGFMVGGPIGAIAGGLLGAAFGAITGYIGGEKIAQWVNKTKKATIEAWDNMWSAMDNVADSIIKGLRAVLPESWTKNLRTKDEREIDATENAVGSQTKEHQEFREETLEKNIKKEEGGARHYKDLKKKLAMTQSEMNELETITDRVFTGDEKKRYYELRMQRSRLNDQIANESTWTKVGSPMSPAGLGINFAKGQTRESSWTGQTGMTKNKMATLASMFKGGIDVTSGFRTEESGDKAMLGSTSDFHKTYGAKTMKGIKDFGQPNSQERKDAIARMRLNGFQSQHEHGNALDFSYPHGYTRATFPQLKKDILGVFPGANLIQEKDHLHMSFSDKALPNQSGKALQDLQTQNSVLSGMGGGGGGTTIVAPQTTKVSQSSTTAVLANPSAANGADPAIQKVGNHVG